MEKIHNEKDIIIFENMEILMSDWKRPVVGFYDPIVYNQLPFLHEGMTVGEFLIEKKYYGEHHSEFLKGTYIPLWQQEEKTAEELRNEILKKYSMLGNLKKESC